MIESGDIQVIIEDGNNANLTQQIAYIKAGKTEIEEAVQEGIGDFDTNATAKTNAFNDNASAKTLSFNQNADAKTAVYDNNASEKLSAYNENATNKLAAYNANDTAKTEAYNLNATNKTTAFNENASEKLSAYNENATNKLAAYNANDTAKTEAYNLNATNKTTAFNNNASEKTSTFNDNAIAKTNGFNSNATSKTNDFNSNASSKTTDFNNNATAKTTAFNDNYTEKKALIDAQVEIAESSATNANNYKNKAREWAISQNVVDNEDYSSKYWAGKSKEWAESVSSPVNKNLSNLNPQGQNIANWSTNVTNCITEIPQDINLELNNGTLTLKAGSKVYVPNGVGVFDVVTVPSDVVFHTGTIGSSTQDLMLCCNLTGGFGIRADPSFFVSGSTEPSNTSLFWYDTVNNMIKAYVNGVWVQKYSFPIGIYHRENGNAVSVKKVFNGFGYIGKRNFITNVKLLIAKGYNTDRTYHNQEYIINSPIVARNNFEDGFIMFFRNNNGYQIYNIGQTFYLGELDYEPAVGSTFQWYYNTTNRMWYMHEQGEQSWKQVDYANIGFNTSTETNFKEVFRAIDYNDSSTISGWAMPSSRYIDLTLGASGSTYTAPANGWAMVTQAFSNSCYIGLATVYPDKDGICMSSHYNSAAVLNAYISVSKGKTFKVFYGGTKVADSANRLEFIYAEGEN